MSYELPRAAKLKKQVESKYIGLDAGRTHKAGKGDGRELTSQTLFRLLNHTIT